MIIQTFVHSSNQVSMEVKDDHHRNLSCCTFTLQQLDQFIQTLSQHRATMAASQQSQRSGGYLGHREAGPAHGGMNPGGYGAWDGSGGGGYGAGGCGNGL